jgi:hypothetical protein
MTKQPALAVSAMLTQHPHLVVVDTLDGAVLPDNVRLPALQTRSLIHQHLVYNEIMARSHGQHSSSMLAYALVLL